MTDDLGSPEMKIFKARMGYSGDHQKIKMHFCQINPTIYLYFVVFI